MFTPLEDLQIKASLISEDEPIITYLDPSDISASPGKEELLQLTAPGIGLKTKIEDLTPFPLSIKEDCLDDDIGNSSRSRACDLKGLKFEPARQDLEEFMASKENLLELSTIISRNWSTAIEENDNYIRIYPDSKTICCFLQGYLFLMVRYATTYTINQDPTVAAGTELVVQGCGSSNHNNSGEYDVLGVPHISSPRSDLHPSWSPSLCIA
jgi:hypothetical protein